MLLLQQRHQRAVQELKGKDLSINDHKKKWSEVQIRLQEFAKLYDIIKVRRHNNFIKFLKGS